MALDHWFSHSTAALLWDLPVPRRVELDERVHVSSNRREPEGAGVVGHRYASRPDVRLHRGFAVLAPAQTWCQLGSVLSLDELVVAGERLLGWPIPLSTAIEIDAAVRGFRGRRGARTIVAAYTQLHPGSASARETRLRRLLATTGFPPPALNLEIRLASGKVTWGDLVYEEFKVLVEYDGEQHRLDVEQFGRDVDRLNALAISGWLVVRIRKSMTDAEVVTAVEAALVARGWWRRRT